VSKCYQEELATFPTSLVSLLERHSTVLHPNMRLSLCRALILLRNKSLIEPVQLHKLFFQLLRCQDKSLRSFLKDNIVNDIKNINSKGKDQKLNSELQNFMYSMLKDSATIAAKTSLDVMATLYRKNVWRDAKTVNVIATGCFSKETKILVAATKFFLGSDDQDDDEATDDEDDLPTAKEVTLANKFNKKTRKREKYLENIKKAHKKKKKKNSAPSYNFSALHLVHDPQEFAEKLFRRLEGLNEKFEVKLMLLELVSRLIGTHQLILLNYYPYIARFLAPHQREVIRLLQFSAQAAHEMVPPDCLEPVLKAIINNFVTERNSSEVMAVGLNAVRELCARCPLVMTEDLLRDLVEYKTYKDKAVMMASKSLIQLFRTTCPELLHKRDRGRPTEANIDLKRKEFGETDAAEFVPGAEVVEDEDEEGDDSDAEEESEEETDDEEGDGEEEQKAI
jgi:protein SDA1